MKPTVNVCQVNSHYLAVVQATVNHQNLGKIIRELLAKSEVYTFLNKQGVQKAGHNIIIYRNDQAKPLLNPNKEFEIEVGVQVAGLFEGDGRVICSSTPQGSAAAALHTGPYHQLGEAHDAIINWSKEHDHPLTGLSWEVYGDWNEDENKLTTEVFYLLK